MDYQPFEINVSYARGVRNTKLLFKPRVYVTVSIVGTSRSTQETPTGKYMGKNMIKWEYAMKFYIEDSKLQQNRVMLVCKLGCRQTLVGSDKVVGEVYIPVKELFDNCCNDLCGGNYCQEVTKPSGEPNGFLYFSYKFGKKIRAAIKSNDSGDQNERLSSAALRPSPSAPSVDYIGANCL